MQCHLRCDYGNTKTVLSSILWMPFVTPFMVTFIEFTRTCFIIEIIILSLPAYQQYSELKEPYFWWSFLSFHKFSELLNFSLAEQNFKDMRTSAFSCVCMATSWLFWFVILNLLVVFPNFLSWVNLIEMIFLKLPILIPRQVVERWSPILYHFYMCKNI